MHLYSTFDDDFQSHIKGAQNLLTSVMALLCDHVLNSCLLRNYSGSHQKDTYFSCSFEKIHKSAKCGLIYTFELRSQIFLLAFKCANWVPPSLNV